MSFPDSHPPFTSRPFTDGSGCWPGFPGNHQDQFMYSDQVPPPKRARNSEHNDSSYGQHIPSTNSRMNPPANPIGSKGTTHIFYKTRMCAKFLDGSCKNGANCTFAHGIEDLREPPPNWQDLVRDGGARNCNDDQRMIHKMKICRKFYNGEECPYGQNCNFLHERPNPNSVSSGDDWPRSNVYDPYKRDSAVISIDTHMVDDKCYDRPDIAKVMSSNSDALIVKPAYWKTKLCSKWEITGQCPFGERCHFAHGQSELHVPSFPVEAGVSTIQMPSTAPAIDPSPGIDVGAQIKVVSENKNFSGWKSKKKINKIYGDWLDDLTPHHASPKEVEDW